jgi:hypothetical protein
VKRTRSKFTRTVNPRMKTITLRTVFAPWLRSAGWPMGVALFCLAGVGAEPNASVRPADGSALRPAAWTVTSSLEVKETYDDNVFMQRVTPLAGVASLVTLAAANAGVQWKPGAGFALALSYGPEAVIFHSARSEDFVAHRGLLTLGGKTPDSTWEWANSFSRIEGGDEGLIFSGPGGAPALGGAPLRDRRAAFVYRGGFKHQQTIGRWLVRAQAAAYVHDFKTQQRATAGYQNYADRRDVAIGFDVGTKVRRETSAFVGYRHGVQRQATVLTSPIQYGNTYDRVLAGLEGKPWSWLKGTVTLGPDFRTFGENVPAGFVRRKTRLYGDAAVAVTASKADTLTLTAKRFEQPGYGGRSAYEDSTYEIGWRRTFSDTFSTSLGARVLNWKFESPVNRNEWWYGVAVTATRRLGAHSQAVVTHSYDRVDSRVPGTAGREARRQQSSLGCKWNF